MATTPQPPPQSPPRNGFGVAALILGIIGVLTGIIPFFFWLAVILGIIGLILGFVGRSRAKRGEATNGTMALWGIITSALAVVLSIVGLVILVGAFEQLDDDLSGVESPAASAPETTSAPAPEEAPATEETPAPEPEPEVAVETFSGSGNDIVTLANPDTEPVRIVKFEAGGEGNTVLWGVDEAGSDIALLVNTIGSYTGTRLINEGFQAQGVVAFKVEASGPWTMEVAPVANARRWDGAEILAGETDDVVIVVDGLAPGLAPVTFVHDGDGNFAVWSYGTSTDLVVNEIGPYNGETLLAEGTILIDVQASGPWSMRQP